jgi:hypothetical protein
LQSGIAVLRPAGVLGLLRRLSCATPDDAARALEAVVEAATSLTGRGRYRRPTTLPAARTSWRGTG